MDSKQSGCFPGGSAKPILILGGSGFIGTRLASLLMQCGSPFRIGDITRSAAFPSQWVECDVRKPDSLLPVVRESSAIINLAAEHRDDVRPISRYDETNVQGAIEVCNAARSAGVGKIVFTSSVAVYGFHSRTVDESGPFVPFNEYGKSKLAAEAVYRAWAAEEPSRTLVIVRPTVVFGEGNRGNVYNLLRQIASGRFFMVGTGQNVKSMAYVGNVAAFLSHCLSFGPGENTFNYVDGPDMPTCELVNQVRNCLGRSEEVRSIPMPIAFAGAHILDVVARTTGRTFPISAIRLRKFCENTRFDGERARRSGFQPPFTLSEGLARTIQFDFSFEGSASDAPSAPVAVVNKS